MARTPTLLLACAALLVACDPSRTLTVASRDAGCRPECAGRACGPDGCGGLCAGTCPANQTCAPETGRCVCSEDDDAFCARLGVVCGFASGLDACGLARQVRCARCAPPAGCDEASGRCRCEAETDAQLCAAAGVDCGPLPATDRCGVGRTAECGDACGPGFVCDANRCRACVNEADAAFCATRGQRCGSLSGIDNCGDARIDVDCGTCAPGFECHANDCVACLPEALEAFCARAGATCGTVTAPDHCRIARTEQCGTCAGSDFCDATHTCHACVPADEATVCAGNGVQCGRLIVVDSCGTRRDIPDCGSCSAIESCANDGTCILCEPQSDADLCTHYGKSCGTPMLVDHCGIRRTPACGTCSAPLSCQPDDVCGSPGVPTNDTCLSPAPLLFDAQGFAAVSGTTVGAGADATSTACGGLGPDVVYRFALTSPSNVAALLAPAANFKPALYVRRTCRDEASEIGCASDASTAGQPARVNLRRLGPGTYYVFVDGYAGSAGSFSLTVTLSAPQPAPANDRCAAATPLVFNAGVATVMDDTTDALDDYAASCGGTGGSDLVYGFALSAPSMVTATVARDASSPALQPAVYIRSAAACSPGAPADAEKACGLQTNGVAVATAVYLPAGSYHVVVDASGDTWGAFQLQVALSPPMLGDSCANPVPLLVDPVTGLASTTGDTTRANDDASSSCVFGGRDLVYQLAVPSDSAMRAEIDVIPISPGYVPALSLRTTCYLASSEVGCIAAASATATRMTMPRLAAGTTYYLWVDGNGPSSNGAFALDVRLLPAPRLPPNDSCAGAQAMALDTAGFASIAGTTAGGNDDYQGGCSSSSTPHDGSDVVYTFTLRSTRTVVAAVQRAANAATFRPAVYIRAECGLYASERACANQATGSTLSVDATAAVLPPGTYAVIVDGIDHTEGDFSLTLGAYEAPANDTCATASRLSFDANGDARVVATTAGRAHDGASSPSGHCGGAGADADVVYSFTLSEARDLTVAESPIGSRLQPVLYVRKGDCASTAFADELGCDAPARGATGRLALSHLAAGTYWIWADSGAYATGPFLLSVHLGPPTPPPANDDCSSAQAIAIDPLTGVGMLGAGTTRAAAGDFHGSCRAASAADVVYAFSLSSTRAVDITVTPLVDSGLRPVAYLRASCSDATTELQCAAASAAGGVAQLAFLRLGQGNYTLFVDSFDAVSSGAFDVRIETRAPGGPAANDLCAAATPMPAFGPAGTTALTGNTVDGNDDESGSCATSASRLDGSDLVYSFVLPAESRVRVAATRGAASTLFRPALSVRGSCDARDEVACALDSSGVSSLSTTLAAGTWYVVVDGVNGSYGPFALEVTRLAAAPVAGEACGNALPLTMAGNAGTAEGSLAAGDAAHDYYGSCATGETGPELVYFLDLASDAAVLIQMAPQGTGASTLQPTVYLRRRCADPATDVACAAGASSGATATLATGRLAAGRYYLFADASSAANTGTFVVSVSALPPSGPVASNDTCATPAPVVFVGDEAHLAGGDTRNAYGDYDGGGRCGSFTGALNGADVVFAFTLAQRETVSAIVTRDTATPGYLPAVSIRSSCAGPGSGDPLACTTSATYPAAGATAHDLDAGTYYVIVDGQRGTAGAFTLDLYKRPGGGPPNTSCAAAEPLPFKPLAPGVEAAVVADDTANGVSAAVGVKSATQSCTSNGSELQYAFSTTTTKDLSLALTPLSGAYWPTVYLRSSCADLNAQVFCAAKTTNAPLSVTRPKLPPGSYTLLVDSYWSSSNGPFLLQVELADSPPAPANDLCRAAQPLALRASGAGPVALAGDTRFALDDYTGACATAAAPFDGGDLAYVFTTTAPTQVTAKVTPTSSTLRPAVYVRATCDATGSEACRSSSGAGPTNPATLAASLSPGTWFLIVDSVAGTFGSFTLEVSVDDGKYRAGDQCLDAVALDPQFTPTATGGRTVTLRGDTALASDDGSGSCGSTTGGDYVYSFEVASDSYVDVSLAPDGAGSTYTSSFYLRRTCWSPASEVACSYTGARSTPRYQRVALPRGTWFLFLDSASPALSGPFVATVTVEPLPPAPANDTCAGAEPLVFTDSVAKVTGSTWLAHDDSAGTCERSAGRDLVYTFTTGAPQKVEAKVTRAASSSAYLPVVYLRSACDAAGPAAELSCALWSSTAGSAVATVNLLPAGTWWVWVDGAVSSSADTAGDFTLEVTLSPPDPSGPANESCPFAQAVALTGANTTLAGTTVGAQNDGVGACVPWPAVAPDVVYAFTTTAAQKITVTVTPIGFAPAVYLRSTCAGTGPGADLACNYSPIPGTTLSTSRNYAPAGTYYVWVDGGSTSSATWSGDFNLLIALDPPVVPPSNDTCASPLPLVLGQVVKGTTVTAYADYFAGYPADWSPACAPSATKPRSRDLVFSFTPAASGTYYATASGSFDVLLWYAEGACGDASVCLGIRDANTGTAPETLPMSVSAGTPYYLYLSSAMSSQGTFTLTLQ